MFVRLRVHPPTLFLIVLLHISFIPMSDAQQPLPYWEVVTDVLTTLDSECWPVHNRGNIQFVFKDLDRNGFEDACVLCADVETFEDAEYSLLTSPRRQEVHYSLQIFLQSRGRMIRNTPVVFDKKRILESFDIVEISTRNPLPFAVSTKFTTDEGTVTEWVVFGPNGSSRISLKEDISNNLLIDDIDADGILDVILYDTAFEEGAGFETYLHWYRWNGRRYAREADANIVRSLNTFFSSCAELISQGDWVDFGEDCVDSEGFADLPEEKRSGRKLLESVFVLEVPPAGASNPPVPENARLAKVVFPVLFENPFSLQTGFPYEFPISVRFITSTESSHLYQATIAMNKNPFGDRQFSFRLR